MTFHPGDTVQLSAGGPLMTVEQTVGDLLLCSWVAPGGRVLRQTYAPQQLEQAEPVEHPGVIALKRLASRWSVVATF